MKGLLLIFYILQCSLPGYTQNIAPIFHDSIELIEIFEEEAEIEDTANLILEVQNESDLKCELIYNQYFKETTFDTAHLNINGYFIYDTTSVPKFFFSNRAILKRDYERGWNNRYDILIISDSVTLMTNQETEPINIQKTNIASKHGSNVIDSLYGWKIDLIMTAEGCLDTQTYSAIIETETGDLIFKNHNNIKIYAHPHKKEIYLFSIRNCRNEFLLYRIKE